MAERDHDYPHYNEAHAESPQPLHKARYTSTFRTPLSAIRVKAPFPIFGWCELSERHFAFLHQDQIHNRLDVKDL